MSETMTVPLWDQTTATLVCKDGPKVVPALTHPWCPGLAVTMLDFGLFRVTHMATGLALGGTYERASNACLELAEWASVARAIGLAWDRADGDAVRAAFAAGQDAPVPFGGAAVTGRGETRPMTVAEWYRRTRDPYGDEFPWESVDDAPNARADAVLATLAPEVTP